MTAADRLALLSGCAGDAFAWGVHDPTVLGWIAFALYLLATAAALKVLIRAPFPSATRGRETVLWLTLTLALALLAANKQLDLQTGVTATLRCFARAEGWYDQRRYLQREAIQFLALMTAIIGLATLIWLRRALWRNLIPLTGFIGLMAFVLLRAISLHHVDRLLKTDILTIRAHRLIELAALVLILVGAHYRARRRAG